ncbi:MAG: Fur family transcriptional regulator [Candidatus Metalachnospira sp.]|nr:Fur family transcriptional regulator [Candidatus Metalachnospira sp.]
MITTTDLLRSKGLKVTPQRIAIMNMLMNTKAHPSAEVIFKTLEPTHPTMSLATVYKTLDSFNEAELIQVLSIDGESLHYDFNTAFHPHFICKQCNSVKDVEVDISDEMDSIVDKINEATDFKINKEQLFFYGTCDECKKK